MNIKKFAEIKVGKTYQYDVNGMFSNLHKGTTSVKVISIENRYPSANSLAKVKSLQTGEEFFTDVGHLQLPIELFKKKFKGTIKYWKRTGIKPKYLKKLDSELSWRNLSLWDGSNSRIVHSHVIVLTERPLFKNIIEVVNSRGYVDSLNIGWIPELNANAIAEQTRLLEEEYSFYGER